MLGPRDSGAYCALVGGTWTTTSRIDASPQVRLTPTAPLLPTGGGSRRRIRGVGASSRASPHCRPYPRQPAAASPLGLATRTRLSRECRAFSRTHGALSQGLVTRALPPPAGRSGAWPAGERRPHKAWSWPRDSGPGPGRSRFETATPLGSAGPRRLWPSNC